MTPYGMCSIVILHRYENWFGKIIAVWRLWIALARFVRVDYSHLFAFRCLFHSVHLDRKPVRSTFTGLFVKNYRWYYSESVRSDGNPMSSARFSIRGFVLIHWPTFLLTQLSVALWVLV